MMVHRLHNSPDDRSVPSRKDDDHRRVKSLDKNAIGVAISLDSLLLPTSQESTKNTTLTEHMSLRKVVSSPEVWQSTSGAETSKSPPVVRTRSKKAAISIVSIVLFVLAGHHLAFTWHQSCSLSLDLQRAAQGLSTVIPDSHFVGIPLSERSYSQVRVSYSTETEVKHPMAVVRLPDDFQGDYQPTSVGDFRALSHKLLDGMFKEAKRSSDYAIVCICIGMDICALTEPNHRAYASKHGFDYLYVSKEVNGVPPKMLKYLALAWAMDRGYAWILMIDADAVITNSTKTIPSLISDAEPGDEVSLIATRGGHWKEVHALNNGIFLLRNTEWSMRHCFEVFTSKYSYTRFLGRTLIDQPVQLSLLVAQRELSWPPKSELERGKHVMIVPKRHLNSFRRDDYYVMTDHEEGGQWHQGDFLAHFASGNKYSLMVDLMEQEHIPGVPPVERRYPFPIPAPGVDNSIKSGSCWCDNQQISCIPRFHVIGVHKAGSKSLMRYLAGHPQLASAPHVEDPIFWLTDAVSTEASSECRKKRLADMERLDYNEQPNPIFILERNTSHAISTCSFKDYSLLHGQYSANKGSCTDDELPIKDLQKPMFDEMVIWGHGLDQVRGTPLPELLRLLQPSANMLISVRNAVDVVYSAYNHFGVFGEGVRKGPGHFHDFVVHLIEVWDAEQCTPANYRRCLAAHPELVAGGSWLSRVMYSTHISAWIEHFGCSQMHLFDTSADPKTEVGRLYAFMGVPNEEAAINATKAVYELKESVDPNESKERSNVLNKASYVGMLNETRAILDDFYHPYHKEMCGLMEKHPCLRVPLFRQFCNSRH